MSSCDKWKKEQEQRSYQLGIPAVLDLLEKQVSDESIHASHILFVRALLHYRNNDLDKANTLMLQLDQEVLTDWNTEWKFNLVMLKAGLAYANGNVELAWSLSAQAKQLMPEELNASIMQLQCENVLSPEKTAASFETLLTDHPNEPLVLLAKGEYDFITGNFEGAYSRAFQVLNQNLDDAHALELATKTAYMLEFYAEAVHYGTMLLEMRPYNANCHLLVSESLIALGNLQLAVEAFHQALRYFPHDGMLHYRLAGLMLNARPDQQQHIIDHALTALELLPEDISVKLVVAYAYANAGNWPKAKLYADELKASNIVLPGMAELEFQIQQYSLDK